MRAFRVTSFFIATLVLSMGLEAKSSIDQASVSMYAVHVPTGKVIVNENSQKSLMPASCIKLVTTAAALHILGPKTRFETRLSYDGKIENGVLNGNIYIVGGGDPCLGSDRIKSSLDWKLQIEEWTSAIQKLGIVQIEGDVIGDASSWEKALAVSTWTWEDLGNYYGAGASALSFHENAYSLIFKPSTVVGERADILKLEPSLSKLELKNEVLTGPEGSGDRACVYGSEFSFIQYIRGTVPAGVAEFVIRGLIPDPALICAELLENSLKEKGVIVHHQVKDEKEKKVFHITYSPTVEEIVHLTNQKSINLYAEHLLKKMGEVSEGEGSSAAGVRAVKKFLKEKGIDLSGMLIADGSGLATKNLITTEQLVSLLKVMKKSEYFPIFFDSLPEQKDSIRAKSGTASLIKGYAGYSNDIAFAILINQCMDPQSVKEKVDSFLSNISKKKVTP
jgi:serine-type D-Ala-D-Ala carboxypeptidase/endopeptidase (penicillin-binding protein 4)